jgi:hypothetical protein
MPLPDSDFDPTESGVPWLTMRDHGHHVVFATPSSRIPRADPKMVTGKELGILSPLLKADAKGVARIFTWSKVMRSSGRSLTARLERWILMRCS